MCGQPGEAAVISQGTNENFVAFEAEAADTLGGADWRIIDLTTPYTHPHPNGKTDVLLPANTNASRGGALLNDFGTSINSIAVYKLNFATAGTYTWYLRDGAFEDGNVPANYGNEDSMFRPPAFNVDPVYNPPGYSTFDPTFGGFSGQTEGQYGWRNSGYTFTVTTPGTYEFRIRPRETGFSIDRMAFSTTTNLSPTQLDALWDSAVGATHFTNGDPADSNWSTAGNWSDGVPTAGSSPLIGGGHTATLTESPAKLFMLQVGHAESTLPGNGTLTQTAGDVTIIDRLVVGKDGSTGVYNATGGTLTIGQTATGRANLYVGYNTRTTTPTSVGTLNLQGASQFNAYLANLVVGQQTANGTSAQAAQGVLTLAENNYIDATSILVSASEMWTTIPKSVLNLGATNTIKTDLLTVAGSRGNGLMKFNAAGGALNLTGSSSDAADLRIAYCPVSTGTATTGTLDLTGGTVNATLDEVVVGYRAGRNEYQTTSTGTMSFSAGAITANSLTIGQGTVAPDGNLGQGIGTLNMAGGAMDVSGNV